MLALNRERCLSTLLAVVPSMMFLATSELVISGPIDNTKIDSLGDRGLLGVTLFFWACFFCSLFSTTMTDLAHMETGTEVHSTSSLDIEHQPDNIIDGDQSTFWTSTGLFPQEFVLKLGASASITKIKTSTTNVRHFVVESCDGPSPVTWVPVFDLELGNTGTGQLQVEVNKVKCLATWLKFKVLSGWSDFVTFHQVRRACPSTIIGSVRCVNSVYFFCKKGCC